MSQGSYQFEALEGRHVEAAFLDQRAELRLDGFIDLVIRHGLPTEGKVLEVGCAHGTRSRMIAGHFPKTEVTGIDRSMELLELGRERGAGVSNLDFQNADLYALPFPDESFDFIYARLVFMHLTDPLRALGSLHRVLKRGGRILIEDADRNCMIFTPAPPSFPAFWQNVQESQRRLGGDPNVGSKLASYLLETGFTHLKNEPQPIVGSGKEIEFLARTLMPSLNLYLLPEDRPAGERAIEDLFTLAKDPRANFYHFWFAVSGEKK